MRLSDKQLKVATWAEQDDPGVMLIASGPRRSGKTEAAMRGLLEEATHAFGGHRFFLVAKSQDQMDSVVMPKVREFFADYGRVPEKDPDSKTGKSWLVPSSVGAPNVLTEIIAVDGMDRMRKVIRGRGFAGGYIDELTEMDADMIPELLATLTETPGAKVWASTNPDSPSHWAKLDYIDKIVSGHTPGAYFEFAATDNPILTPEQMDALASLYSGVFYDRMVLGKWVAATGLVHPTLPKNFGPPPDLSECRRWEVAIDFGRSSVTCALLIGYFRDRWCVVDEWVHDGRKYGEMAVKDQARNIYDWATNGRSVATWIVPFDAHGIAEEWKGYAQGDVVDAYQDVLTGINFTNLRLQGRADRPAVVQIGECPGLIRDLGNYSWAKTPSDKGQDVPDKKSADGAHFADAFRYWCATAEADERGILAR